MQSRVPLLAAVLAALLGLAGCNSRKGADEAGAPAGGGAPAKGDAPAPHVFPTASMTATELEKVRETSRYQLQTIALAISYAEKKEGFYPAGIWGPDGKSVGLSWRVLILPYIDPVLYKEFKLAEPWDSPHNKALIPKMPNVYAAPGTEPAKGLTYYRSFTGPRTVMPPALGPGHLAAGLPVRGAKFNQVLGDGTDNTGLVAEALEPVVWTKPDELYYADGKALPKLGGVFESGYHVLFCSYTIRFIPKDKLDDQNLRRLILIDDGETLKLP